MHDAATERVIAQLNFQAGVNIANATTVALNTNGEVCVFTSATAHYALDVVAYIGAPEATSPTTTTTTTTTTTPPAREWAIDKSGFPEVQPFGQPLSTDGSLLLQTNYTDPGPTVTLTDVRADAIVAELPPSGGFSYFALSLSPDGSGAILQRSDGQVVHWDPGSGVVSDLGSEGACNARTFSEFESVEYLVGGLTCRLDTGETFESRGVSPNGRYAGVVFGQPPAVVDGRTGQIVSTLPAGWEFARSVEYSRHIANNGTALVVNPANERLGLLAAGSSVVSVLPQEIPPYYAIAENGDGALALRPTGADEFSGSFDLVLMTTSGESRVPNSPTVTIQASELECDAAVIAPAADTLAISFSVCLL